MRGTALEWFNSYLSNRCHYVYVNGHNSSHLNVTCGVPQGSVDGPFLFLIYINDLPSSSIKLPFYLFADKVVNKELMKIKKWLDANKLASYIAKTNFVIFHSPQIALVKLLTPRLVRIMLIRLNILSFLVSFWMKTSAGSTTGVNCRKS